MPVRHYRIHSFSSFCNVILHRSLLQSHWWLKAWRDIVIGIRTPFLLGSSTTTGCESSRGVTGSDLGRRIANVQIVWGIQAPRRYYHGGSATVRVTVLVWERLFQELLLVTASVIQGHVQVILVHAGFLIVVVIVQEALRGAVVIIIIGVYLCRFSSNRGHWRRNGNIGTQNGTQTPNKPWGWS